MSNMINKKLVPFWTKFWLLFCLVSTTLIVVLNFSNPTTLNGPYVSFFGVSMPFILLIFQYHSLRKLLVFSLWLIFSLFSLGAYFLLQNNANLILPSGLN